MLFRSPTQAQIPRDPAKLEALPNSCFSSYSLTSCVTALLELETAPGCWEEAGMEWFVELDRWANMHRLQVVRLPFHAMLRGWHIRFLMDDSRFCLLSDGNRSNRVEAVLYFGEEIQLNPANFEGPFDAMKLVFLPYDPVPSSVKFAQ